MYKQLDCIALRTVKYSDRNSILTAYTRQEGRMSFLVPAGNGKAASRLRALLMPLGRFECVADLRPGKEIYPIRDVAAKVFPPVADPLRATLALFTADLLTDLLREPMADPLLFEYLDSALRILASEDGRRVLSGQSLLNFHLCFLVRLTRFLGIEPDWMTYRSGSVLDLNDGIFRQLPPNHRNYLPCGESAVAAKIGRISFSNLGLFKFNRFERNTILDRILRYYQIHYPSIGQPQSLAVLRLLAD